MLNIPNKPILTIQSIDKDNFSKRFPSICYTDGQSHDNRGITETGDRRYRVYCLKCGCLQDENSNYTTKPYIIGK